MTNVDIVIILFIIIISSKITQRSKLSKKVKSLSLSWYKFFFKPPEKKNQTWLIYWLVIHCFFSPHLFQIFWRVTQYCHLFPSVDDDSDHPSPQQLQQEWLRASLLQQMELHHRVMFQGFIYKIRKFKKNLRTLFFFSCHRGFTNI